MLLSDALSIAVPAIALIAVLVVPGTPRWGRRPWLADNPPRRALITAFLAVLLLAAVAHALA